MVYKQANLENEVIIMVYNVSDELLAINVLSIQDSFKIFVAKNSAFFNSKELETYLKKLKDYLDGNQKPGKDGQPAVPSVLSMKNLLEGIKAKF